MKQGTTHGQIIRDRHSSCQVLIAGCLATCLFEAKERPKPHIFFIHSYLVIALFRMAEVNDRNSRVAHKYIFTTDISVNYARAMNRRQR
jgi:hypothetical protein